MASPSQKAVFAAAAALLLAGIGLAFAYAGRFADPDQLATHLRAAGLWAPIMVVVLMVLHNFIPFPAEILAICAGAVFGVVTGAVLIWTGAMLGALVAFALARWLGRDVVRGWLSEAKAGRLDDWSKTRGALTLLVLRLLPVVAFNLINYAAGLTSVRLWTFVWTTAIGILPITVLCTWLGSHMRTLTWPDLMLLSAICLALLFLLHRLTLARGWI